MTVSTLSPIGSLTWPAFRDPIVNSALASLIVKLQSYDGNTVAQQNANAAAQDLNAFIAKLTLINA
jgi:hypothetical protein